MRGEPNSPRRQSIVLAGPNLSHLTIMDDLKDVRGSCYPASSHFLTMV
jgi:hypothetical protein